MNSYCTLKREIRHFHLFCGLGGGAAGFNRGKARVGNVEADFVCLGGIDIDPLAIKDFGALAGVPGTVLDLFSRDQYVAFHGQEPPIGWVEASPEDIQKAAQNKSPHIVFLSAPCKGFSGLLSQRMSGTDKYQALNQLTLRGVWLMLEAFKSDLPELIVFENVPRIANRGRRLLDQIVALLQRYGYATAETTHDCGELGGLAQSRKRFLLVARHEQKVPPFLYEPVKKPLESVGTILGRMPMPGDTSAGAMHRVPRLQWKTWVRLAFVEAGRDWRSLNNLAVEDGYLRDYLIVPDYRAGYLGVNRWDEPSGAVAGRNSPSNGKYSVADPRYRGQEFAQYGVVEWNQAMGVVTGQRSPGQGRFSVADPRQHKVRHNNVFRVVHYGENSGAITSGHGPSSGGQAVADPRGNGFAGKYHVTPYHDSANTIIAGSTTGQGAFAVADPRGKINSRGKGDNYLTGGHYGVVGWSESSGAVASAACHDNGRFSVADPRLPEETDQLVAVIQSLDDCWHRPFTTAELACLQGLFDPEEYFELSGLSDSAWRERIGNAVPPPAAEAIATVMGETLLLAWAGETFVLGSTPIWVRPMAAALSLSQNGSRVAY
jgi:site-specific DNA-cytosine methylase